MIEIVPIEQLALYVDNPKAKAGNKYQRALDTMLQRYGQVGAVTLSPRCSRDDAPALFDKFGATCGGRYIVADGNLRRDTLARLGWTHALVLPGPDRPEGDPGLMEKFASAPRDVRDRYRALVGGGAKVALGIVYPFLDTPAELAQFTLGFDRARRGYDETVVQRLRDWLITEARADANLVATISVSSQASIRRLMDAEKQQQREQAVREEQERKAAAERALAEAAAAAAEDRAERGEESAPFEPAPAEPAAAVRLRQQVRADARVVFTNAVRLTVAAFGELERLLGVVRTHAMAPGRDGKFLAVVERAARRLELGDAAVEVLVDRVKAMGAQGQAETLSVLIEQARKFRAEDDVLMAAVVVAAREGLDAIEADKKRR